MLDASEPYRASRRMRHALVADWVLEAIELGNDDWAAELLGQRMDPDDWTQHLARQLKIRRALPIGGVHDTLRVLVPELDRLLSDWPLPTDGPICDHLVEAATKSLDPVETYATLIAGPATWHTKCTLTGDVTLDQLDREFRKLLQRGLVAELRGLFERWTSWNVIRLDERRVTRPPPPPPTAAPREAQSAPTDAERQQARADRRKLRNAGGFIPPPPGIR